jgi:hypothetical protein
MSEVYSGRCLCGAIKFEARGKPKGIFWCHCDSCRRHTGAPVSVFAGFANDAVAVTQGEITTFKSSPGTTRGFCARCGSTLTCATVRLATETHYHIGAFERAAELAPKRHLFENEQLPWLRLHDNSDAS